MSAREVLRDSLGSLAATLNLWPILRLPRRANERLSHRARTSAPSLTAYAVYRASNEDNVLRFVRGLPPDTPVHLHALDAVSPALAAWTRATGPGARMPLLQAMVDDQPPREGDHVLLFDDDVVFPRSSPDRFAGLAMAAGFDLAQPAHGVKSNRSFRFNRVAWLSTARHTRMVEIGPVLLISARAQRLVMPFPSDSGMGFGLDVQWAALRSRGLQLGVVDATPIRHLGTIASAYSLAEELEHLRHALDAQGLTSVYDLDTPLEGPTWRPWQALPPWATQP